MKTLQQHTKLIYYSAWLSTAGVALILILEIETANNLLKYKRLANSNGRPWKAHQVRKAETWTHVIMY